MNNIDQYNYFIKNVGYAIQIYNNTVAIKEELGVFFNIDKTTFTRGKHVIVNLAYNINKENTTNIKTIAIAGWELYTTKDIFDDIITVAATDIFNNINNNNLEQEEFVVLEKRIKRLKYISDLSALAAFGIESVLTDGPNNDNYKWYQITDDVWDQLFLATDVIVNELGKYSNNKEST